MRDPAPSHTIDLADSDPKSGPTAVAAAVGTLVLVAGVFWIEALYRETAEAERERKVVSQEPAELRTVEAAQIDQLHGYRWVDRSQGVVAIPIERAMELVIQDAAAARRARGGAP
jgi:hypothetical protein